MKPCTASTPVTSAARKVRPGKFASTIQKIAAYVVSESDAMQLTGPPAADATAANLVMLTSKGGNECRKGDIVAVNFADLQDMQNAMRETVDQGLQTLQAKQGTGGLPAAPASARVAPVETAFAKNAPPPDADVQTQVTQQLAEGDKGAAASGCSRWSALNVATVLPDGETDSATTPSPGPGSRRNSSPVAKSQIRMR